MTVGELAEAQAVNLEIWKQLKGLTKYVEVLKAEDQPHGVRFFMVLAFTGRKEELDRSFHWNPVDGFSAFDGYETRRFSRGEIATGFVQSTVKRIRERMKFFRDSAKELEDDLAEMATA